MLKSESDPSGRYRPGKGGLPAVIAVQSGINVPRYASLIAIRKAAKKEITTVGRADTFLASLGFLRGEPAIKEWVARHQAAGSKT